MQAQLTQKRGPLDLLVIGFGFIFIGIICLIIHLFQSYNPGKITVSAPFGIGSFEIDRSALSGKELDIAWKLYVQLSTRKAAIPINEEDDLITGVYDSWYELFKSTREYLLEMPAQDLAGNDNAQKIVNLSLEVLNQGLRPHLNKWQAKYRMWYEEALQDPANKGLTPQEIQRKYPHYEEVITDMKRVNGELVKYAEELKRFSYEKPPSGGSKAVSWFMELLGGSK
ncbi:hypothetical protein [Brevibacillus dissolubilis]|uniref:hypothetical protein n=1 Tax=Brevibacillus dissolubilis TaxID=1844116 RepID=UPI001115C7E9|nr:hypothetical protein [Brevibacillus dissolubilis]